MTVYILFDRCVCTSYTDPDAICDSNCRSTQQPTLSPSISSTGVLEVNVADPSTGQTVKIVCIFYRSYIVDIYYIRSR